MNKTSIVNKVPFNLEELEELYAAMVWLRETRSVMGIEARAEREMLVSQIISRLKRHIADLRNMAIADFYSSLKGK